MNWNGQRDCLEHLIAKRIDANRANSLQNDFNVARLKRLQSALHTRPVFLPLAFEMNAAGQISPYRDTTPSLAYDVIITGIKADNGTRDIVIRRTEDDKPMVYVGDELNLFLRTDEIAGQGTTTGGGQAGVFYLPKPIVLPAGNRLTIEMYKDDTTADPEEANIVLVGVRVFNRAYGELLLDAAERQKIDYLIQAREVPRVVFLKHAIEFDSAGAGGLANNIYTPQVEEPLLIRGVRTTLRHSAITMRVEGEPNWTVSPTPIWGIAAEDDLGHDNYQWFSKPIFLHSKTSIEIERVTNSIDGSLIDAQTGNSITWLCETV